MPFEPMPADAEPCASCLGSGEVLHPPPPAPGRIVWCEDCDGRGWIPRELLEVDDG